MVNNHGGNGGRRGGWWLLHRSADNVFKRIEDETNTVSGLLGLPRWVFTNPLPCIVHVKNRKAMKEVRAKYAPFIKYMKNIKKLLGDTQFTSDPPEQGYLNHTDVLALATSNDPLDHYKAMVQLAWRGHYQDSYDPIVRLDGILTSFYRDEVLDEVTLPGGEIKIDNYASLF
jgi:hypothetical protein